MEGSDRSSRPQRQRRSRRRRSPDDRIRRVPLTREQVAKEQRRAARRANSRLPTVPRWAWGVLLLVLVAFGVGVALGTFGGDEDGDPTEAVATTATPVVIDATSTTAEPAAITTVAAPTTTTTTATTTVTTVPATTSTTSTTTSSTTTVESTTTTLDPARLLEEQTLVGGFGETLIVTPRRDSCSGGSDCLVVAIAIEGWGTHPRQFVCEFSSGARFTFRFTFQQVDSACATGDRPDSIVVEVGSLRSEPILNP